MKVLRGIGNTIIGIILFALIFSLLFISKTSNLLEGDVLKETIKTAIDDVSDNDKNLTESQKKAIDDMFKDGDASKIISMVLDNYKEYKNNINYKVSHEDAKALFDFVNKYRTHIKRLSNEDVSSMTEKEFEEYFNNNKIDEFAKSAFKEFDKNLDSDVINKALDAYTIATSNSVKIAIIFTIVLFIGLLLLINWSLIKWMIIVGIDLIISGVLFIGLFAAAEILKDMLLKEEAKINFNFNSFLISGVLQIVIGIVLIVVYNILKIVIRKKKPNNNDDNNVTINNQKQEIENEKQVVNAEIDNQNNKQEEINSFDNTKEVQ